MPNYQYECKECNYVFDIFQSIKDAPLRVCPECQEESIYRVIHAAMVLTKGEPKTVIQQADRNERAMGRYELEDKRQEVNEVREKVKAHRPKTKKPWWRKTEKINTELAKLAPSTVIEKGKIVKSEPLSEKATDYIMTGNNNV